VIPVPNALSPGGRLRLGLATLLIGLVLQSPAVAQVRPRFGVRTPMRDQVELSADLWLPAAPGRVPTIVMRTPYLKTDDEVERAPHWGALFAAHGYAFLMQDVRGRGDSDGRFDFFFQEANDGYDTVEWIARQPWSDGQVGMMGSSYLGTLQWLAARLRPPALRCIAPTAAAGRWFDELPYLGGAFLMSWAINWINGTSGRIGQSNARTVDRDQVYAHRPLLTMDEALGRRMPLYRAMLEHPTIDDYWGRLMWGPSDFAALAIPALHVTGWFDGDQPGALFYWEGMQRHSTAAETQRLLIGPWTHGQTFTGGALAHGAFELSASSVVDVDSLHLGWFDECFRSGRRHDVPAVRAFVTGSNQWVEGPTYPLPGTIDRSLYLRSGGRANSLIGDGRLAWEAPGAEPPDRYRYDPAHPAPASIGDLSAAEDRRPIQRRDDVLVYSTEPLTEPLTVIGRLRLLLHAASDGRDTDFIARVSDVFPDGRAVALAPGPGAIRARYRQGFDRTVPLDPGARTELRIDLHDIGHTFLAGHRIRLEVTSSAYPEIHPNPNTGNPIATDTSSRVARQTIYHQEGAGSRLVLPIYPLR